MVPCSFSALATKLTVVYVAVLASFADVDFFLFVVVVVTADFEIWPSLWLTVFHGQTYFSRPFG
jgi:hypothetical protein